MEIISEFIKKYWRYILVSTPNISLLKPELAKYGLCYTGFCVFMFIAYLIHSYYMQKMVLSIDAKRIDFHENGKPKSITKKS